MVKNYLKVIMSWVLFSFGLFLWLKLIFALSFPTQVSNWQLLDASTINNIISHLFFKESNWNVYLENWNLWVWVSNPSEKLVVNGNIVAWTGVGSWTVIHLPCTRRSGATTVECNSDEIVVWGGVTCPNYFVPTSSYPTANWRGARCTKYNAREWTSPSVYAICCKK